MNHDADVYGDPDNFRPERFLDETETEERIPINTHGEVFCTVAVCARPFLNYSLGSYCIWLRQTQMHRLRCRQQHPAYQYCHSSVGFRHRKGQG